MNVYRFLIFVHVVGGVGVFVAMGIEAVSLGGFQRADTPAELRGWMRLLALPGRLGPIAMLTTLVSGLWMMALAWRYQPWIVSAFVGLVGMAILGGGITGRSLRRLRGALDRETGSELSSAFHAVRSSAALMLSLRVRIAIGVGILGLMTVKPDVAGSSLILAAAVLLGLLASTPLATRRARLAEAPVGGRG